MKRIIKFRAWDEKSKCMFYSDKTNLGTFFDHIIWGLEPELMQFTGILDKNGKEVFESDVVMHKYKRPWQTNYHKSIVVWDQEWCCFYLFDGVSKHRMRDDIEYEVIENLYDNPELIK